VLLRTWDQPETSFNTFNLRISRRRHCFGLSLAPRFGTCDRTLTQPHLAIWTHREIPLHIPSVLALLTQLLLFDIRLRNAPVFLVPEISNDTNGSWSTSTWSRGTKTTRLRSFSSTAKSTVRTMCTGGCVGHASGTRSQQKVCNTGVPDPTAEQ
jgi:hypothetical protein